jgi:hypothetical protein
MLRDFLKVLALLSMAGAFFLGLSIEFTIHPPVGDDWC